MPRSSGRILAYARVSSEEQAKGTSLKDQQESLSKYATSRGLTVHRFYVEAESGIFEKAEKREQIQLLLKEAREGDLVLCDKLDRWSRDPEFTYGSIRRLLERNIGFFAVSDNCDPSTRDGDTMLGVRVLVAREEHKRIRERTLGTRQILRDKGYYIDGKVPLGYVRPVGKGITRLEHNVLAEDPETSPMVRTIYGMCIRGLSLVTIADRMREQHPERYWDKRTIATVLRNRVYLGEVKDSHGTWIKAMYAPILQADIFSRAQIALDSRRLRGPGPYSGARTKDWLLRQIGLCARCDARVSSSYGGGPRTGAKQYTYYYICPGRCPGSRYMRVEPLDAAVSAMVLDRLLELRERIAVGAEPPKQRGANDFEAERGRLQRKRERYLEAFSDEGMTKAELHAALAKVDEARTKLDAKAAEAGRDSPLADPSVRRQALAMVETIRKAWGRGDAVRKRDLLHVIASAVRIEHDAEPKVKWLDPEQIAADLRP